MDVSVVLVSWNTRALLLECLRSLQEQTRGASCEVIVVDNDSRDGSAEAVAAGFPAVRLIRNRTNPGFARGCNQGMAAAAGRWVLLLNTDTLLLNDAVSATLDYAERHPRCAAAGCRVLNPDGSVQESCFMFPSLLNLFLESSGLSRLFPGSPFFGRAGMSWWDRGQAREVEVVSGCFLLLRREALRCLGMLDEDYFVYGEETDFCYRARQAGWQCAYVPAGRILHYGGQSAERARPQMTLQLRSSILLFFRKHRGRAAYALACALTGLFFLLRLPYWLLAAVSRARRAACLATGRVYAAGFRKSFGGWQALRARLQS
jgi:GT2 family glycosyltransferase